MLQQEETRKYRSKPLECYEIFTINLFTLTSSSTPAVDDTTGHRHMQSVCNRLLLRSMLGERNTKSWDSLVLKGDLLWYLFHCTSAFSAPSWIIYLARHKNVKYNNLTNALSSGCMAQWIMCYHYTLKVSGSTPAMWYFFLFFVVVLFCFVSVLKKHIGSILQHQYIY